MYPVPGNGADVTLGAAAPGIGFAFVQVPDDIAGLVADGSQSLPVVTARACGLRYRLTGFAYRLTRPPQITSLRLKRLAWLDASGQAFASTTALPRYGYAQFQP